jgi:hypothetical protein
VSSNRSSQGGGLSITTLLIAGASSAVAAFIVQTFWQRGTVFAAAMTPVIVALVSETLKKPVEAVSAVRVRRTPEGTALLDPVEPPPDPDEPFDPLAPLPTEELEAALTDAPAPPRSEHRRRRLTARQWKIGVATGLIAFFCAAAVVTASELAIFGDSVSNSDRRTTFFGGRHQSSSSSSSEKEKATPTPTETATPKESATPNAKQTPTPTPTATPTPTQTPAPQGVAPGATATPAPGATPTP